MKTTGLIIMMLVCFCSFGQTGKLNKADELYAKIAYAKAASVYEQLIGSEVDSPALKSKLADCYYQIGHSVKAEAVYASMVSSPEVKAQDIYQYAQALKENGKYDLSNEWMLNYSAKYADDSRAIDFNSNQTYLDQIKSQEAYFSVKHLSMNTENAEFGGYPFGESKSYFISNRRKQIAVQRVHTFNSQSFLDIYSSDIGVNNELENVEMISKKINKKYHEGPLCFSSDLKKVYFTRNNMSKGSKRKDQKGIQNLKLYVASVDTDGKWYNEKELSVNSKEFSIGHPTLSSDGKTLYFASDMVGGYGGTDLYKVTINKDGSYGKPENLGEEINTEGNEIFPWISSEGLLFFSSDGHLGLGGLDVFVMLTDKQGKYGKLLNVGAPVNGQKDDFALVMNADNTTGYFSSNREGGSGDDDIYSFNLLRPFKVNLMIEGVVTEMRSNEIVPNATVNLLDDQGAILQTKLSDENGNYSFDIEPGLDYGISVQKDDYFDNSSTVSSMNVPNDEERINKDLLLEKDPGLALYFLISDVKTNLPLEGVSIKITDNITGEDFITTTTTVTGDLMKGITDRKIDERLSYNIVLTKEGYFPKTVTFNHKIEEPGIINVHDFLKNGLSMDKEVKDLTEMIEIKPINFDLGKWNIRDDAKVELDKIVAVMNTYPDMIVELGSHTDCRASKAFNLKLSNKRANASADYIKSKITTPDRIYGKGYGESQLLNGCECEGSVKSDCSEDEHEKNRRTEFKVITSGGANVQN